MFNPIKIILHHSAVSRTKNNKQFDAINEYHSSKGWGGIGYHFLIEPDGLICKGRKEDEDGCHTIGQNEIAFGICLTGDFDTEDPTQKQLKSLKGLITYLRIKYNIPINQVFGHRNFATKTCPGIRFTNELIKSIMSLKELKRDEHGGFWFIKSNDGGKQKITATKPNDAISLLITIISREFGVDQITDKDLQKLTDKNYI